MKMRTKKGQGALEFLMTYGWAFLVILIMIAALTYFGVLNPSKWLPDRCNFGSDTTCEKGAFAIFAVQGDCGGADVGCAGAGLTGADTIRLVLKNNLGQSVYVTDGDVESEVLTWVPATPGVSGDEFFVITTEDQDDINELNGAVDDTVLWPDGTKMTVGIDADDGDNLVSGDKVKISVSFKWFPLGSDDSYAHTTKGEIYAVVQ